MKVLSVEGEVYTLLYKYTKNAGKKGEFVE